MDGPPKPKTSPDDLAEVERALSVLQGRHPEHERARREDQAARDKRQGELDGLARDERRRSLARQLKIVVIAAVVIVVATVVGLVFRSEFARHGRIEAAGVPYRSMGFVVEATSSRGSAGTIETTPEGGCFVAVTTGSAPIKVTLPTTTFEGPAPVTFCTCQADRIVLSSAVESRGGLSLLRKDTATIGGSKAFAFLPFVPKTAGASDALCAEASFEAWIDAKHYRELARNDAWLAAPAREPLRRRGFVDVGTIAAEAPFGVVQTSAESCLVVAPEGSDKVAIRTKSGVVLVPETPGPVAWCATAAELVVVQREGKGSVAITQAPAASLGGLSGLREATEKASLPLAQVQIPPADRAWMAKLVLLASAIPAALVTTATTARTGDIPADKDARLVSLSFAKPNALVADTPADTFSFCMPPLAQATESVCAFSGPHAWRIAGADAVAGVARTKLPFWLLALEGVGEPEALKAEIQLVDLARRLKREGFEPTTLEAITELPNGAEILGRTGEDAIVAVGIAPVAPWVFPYSNGPYWTIDQEPPLTPIRPLERVTLTIATPPPAHGAKGAKKAAPKPAAKSAPKSPRRTVVFRRQTK